MDFNSGIHRPWLGWFGKVWWMDNPFIVRQGVAAARRAAVRSSSTWWREGCGHPLRTCTAEMKDYLMLKHHHQTTTSYCIFPIPQSLKISLSTLNTIWYTSAVGLLSHHGYPLLKMSQQDNPRRHSQITWIQFTHLCIICHSSDLFVSLSHTSIRWHGVYLYLHLSIVST